jgi:hypothetical protein
MTDYTPGPWHYETTGPGLLGAFAGDDLIAGVASSDNQEANARLIAAAPDLLAALDDLLLKVFAADENEDGERICAVCQRPDYLDCNPNESCGRARAAIAKARGEAQS